jgi:hypothetical protein
MSSRMVFIPPYVIAVVDPHFGKQSSLTGQVNSKYHISMPDNLDLQASTSNSGHPVHDLLGERTFV